MAILNQFLLPVKAKTIFLPAIELNQKPREKKVNVQAKSAHEKNNWCPNRKSKILFLLIQMGPLESKYFWPTPILDFKNQPLILGP